MEKRRDTFYPRTELVAAPDGDHGIFVISRDVFRDPREISFGTIPLFVTPEGGGEFGVALTSTNRPLDQIDLLPQVGQPENPGERRVTKGESGYGETAIENPL